MLKYVEIIGVVWLIYNRRKFRSQTSDSMDRWKAEMGRVREKRRVEERREEERRSEKRKSQKQEDAGARKGRKVAKHNVFPMICGSRGSTHFEVKMYKTHQVRTTFGSWDVEKVAPLWREAHLQVKKVKAPHVRTTFGSCDVEKVHAVVARSAFRFQNVQSTPGSDHSWKLRCLKSARRCGAKHISKSKCTKHTRFGPLLEVAMSKKFTPLWRKARLQVKKLKTHHVRTTFGSWDV